MKATRREPEPIHDRFFTRMEAALTKLQASADNGRLVDAGLAHERLGRLRERYWRSAGAFKVRITPIANPIGPARLKITWSRGDRWRQWTEVSEGCYLLRTNLTDVAPATLWQCYIQLTEAEWAFRITKDELKIRPIWHQKEDRVRAHILVRFLACVLWKTLARWMKASGLGDAPRTLVEELAKIKSGDVVLKARRPDGEVHDLRVRCVTTPDKAQKVLLNRLGLHLPRRLRTVHEVERM